MNSRLFGMGRIVCEWRVTAGHAGESDTWGGWLA
jgi:hypothetical protein